METGCFLHQHFRNLSSYIVYWYIVYVWIGPDRPATSKDRADMPYTDAVLLETLRKGNIVPGGLPRTLDADMIVDGVVSITQISVVTYILQHA